MNHNGPTIDVVNYQSICR